MQEKPIILDYATAAPTWQTVAHYRDSFEANLAKLKLESEDITCFIDGENMFSAVGGYPLDAGGMKLKVAPADYERAAQILGAIAEQRTRRTDAAKLKCPACQRLNVRRDQTRLYIVWIFLAAGIVAIFTDDFAWSAAVFFGIAGYLLLTVHRAAARCRDCGYRWRPAAPADKNLALPPANQQN